MEIQISAFNRCVAINILAPNMAVAVHADKDSYQVGLYHDNGV